MIEPCENCGTPVVVMDLVANIDPQTGWRVVDLPDGLPAAHLHMVDDAVEGVGLYEGTRGEDRRVSHSSPTVAYSWFEHTSARCRAVRRQGAT